MFSRITVNLWMKEKVGVFVVGRNAPGRQRIDAPELSGNLRPAELHTRRGKMIIQVAQVCSTIIAYALDPIRNQERSHGGRAVIVHHIQYHLDSRTNIKQDRNTIAETDVLCSLPYVKSDLTLSTTSIFGIYL